MTVTTNFPTSSWFAYCPWPPPQAPTNPTPLPINPYLTLIHVQRPFPLTTLSPFPLLPHSPTPALFLFFLFCFYRSFMNRKEFYRCRSGRQAGGGGGGGVLLTTSEHTNTRPILRNSSPPFFFLFLPFFFIFSPRIIAACYQFNLFQKYRLSLKQIFP